MDNNPWKDALIEEGTVTWALREDNKNDPVKLLRDIINWHVTVALDPTVSSEALKLIERGRTITDKELKELKMEDVTMEEWWDGFSHIVKVEPNAQ